ncbi:very short patch repair endonuclease [Rhizobium brockwellii]|uniref:very short patch repair endonuclease n=1 Tax=Rhizobium brockwellii TaxID=3019932 RepID=UPI003F963F97
MDKISTIERRRNMSRVRSVNTRPELTARKLIFGLGYRFRVHDRTIPGSPDIVFKGRKAVIFVHGCFWHQHCGCKRATIPKSNKDFWASKLKRNVERDAQTVKRLNSGGWRVLVVWECELRRADSLAEKISEFLGPVRWRNTLLSQLRSDY